MTTQERFVTACQKYYARRNLEPGNPEHGEWQQAHYPVPKCLNGQQCVWLLRHHHAIQGVLQSEEYQRPCIYGWELTHLRGKYLAIAKRWMAEKAKPGQRAAREAWKVLDQVEFSSIQSRRGKQAWDNLDQQQRSALIKERWDNLEEAERAERLRKGLQSLWKCTVTGKVANPGVLTRYQRRLGIDTANRERVPE